MKLTFLLGLKGVYNRARSSSVIITVHFHFTFLGNLKMAKDWLGLNKSRSNQDRMGICTVCQSHFRRMHWVAAMSTGGQQPLDEQGAH